MAKRQIDQLPSAVLSQRDRVAIQKAARRVPGGVSGAAMPVVERPCVCGPEVKAACGVDRIRPGSKRCVIG